MANLNRVMLIGRLTRDPEPIQIQGTTKGARFGFAVNNRKKNNNGGWDDVPVFIDCEAWNRGDSNTMGVRILETLRKGQQVYLDGHLKLDQWEDKNGGGKRSALRVVVDEFQYLEKKQDGGDGGGSGYASTAGSNTVADPFGDDQPPARGKPGSGYSYDSEIPF